MARQSKSEKVPKSMKPTFDTIVALTNSFCEEHLNEEYAQLARQATAALCRKRRSPLTSGRAKYLDKITSLFFNYLLLVILRSAAKPVPSLRSRTSSKLAAGKNLMP